MQPCTQQNFEDPLPQGVLEIPINLSVIKGIAEEKTYTKMKEFVSEIYMEPEKILLNMKIKYDLRFRLSYPIIKALKF